MFLPHRFEPKVEFVGKIPHIFVSKAAYDRMRCYVELADKEIGWLGSVKSIDNGDFLIEEVFLFRQQVSASETEISSAGIAEVANRLITTRQDGEDVCARLQFWGHSHVNMGTSPSYPDEAQLQQLRSSDLPWFIRGILNKNGRMEFTIFFYERGVKITDLSWSVYESDDDKLREEIKVEMAEKVSEKTFVPHPKHRHWPREMTFGDEDEYDGAGIESPPPSPPRNKDISTMGRILRIYTRGGDE